MTAVGICDTLTEVMGVPKPTPMPQQMRPKKIIASDLTAAACKSWAQCSFGIFLHPQAPPWHVRQYTPRGAGLNNGTVAVTVAPAVTQSHAYCFGTECRLLPCASIANRGGIQAH